ncbi:uncharacterized protein LOC135693741, partial [Rhopilema esculentum]|uniref:uncharacterized protein LOC135693741 n=1 Tax=Rhopilema esculentum TaxID=499914 RepID=UPI0031D7AEA4
MLQIHAECLNGHETKWMSQPLHNQMALGNLFLAASCLFSGSQCSKLLCFFHHLNMPSIAIRTYSDIQRAYLIPTVNAVWAKCRQELFVARKNMQLVLGGDARMDSPGHSAKYGSYSLMDLGTNKVIDLQLVQSNEVGGANHMELEGLKPCLQLLDSEHLLYTTLVTDRHGPVRKFMRTERKETKHLFDVFHVAKSIGKKVEAIGKKKGNRMLLQWVQSIKNHVYWCAASSCGNATLIKEKWLSLFNHIVDIHTGHGNEYKECPHDSIERDWLKKGSKGYKELVATLNKTKLVNDITRLSPLEQTSALESFHNVIIRFAPKNTHFFYLAMKARLFLAAMHFNENSQRAQQRKETGEKMWNVSYPKYRSGDGVVQEVKE